MNLTQAANVLDIIQAGWSWQIPSPTYKLWRDSIAGWEDTEAAEIAVIELVSSLTHRPNLGQIHEHYTTVVRRLAEERPTISRHDDPMLPASHVVLPASPGLAWSPEGARWAVGSAEGAVWNGRLHEGASKTATLREADVVDAEEAAKAAFLSRGETPADRVKAAIKTLVKMSGLEKVGKK